MPFFSTVYIKTYAFLNLLFTSQNMHFDVVLSVFIHPCSKKRRAQFRIRADLAKLLIILHNAVALHLISYVNTCVTTATTDAFELQSKEIRYQPRSGKRNHNCNKARIGTEWNGYAKKTVRRDGGKASIELCDVVQWRRA